MGVSYDRGVLLFTVKRRQRKIFEIYDELMYSAIGNQADVEAVRLAAIDFAHKEGFQRSPDDVSIQRLVGFAISPAIKQSFGDPMSTPHVLRAIFAEVGRRSEQDAFFVLNYDGEFVSYNRYAVVAGSSAAEDAMVQELDTSDGVPDLSGALQRAAAAWRKGSSGQDSSDDDEVAASATNENDPLLEALKNGHLEAAVLERDTPRESKFRMLRDDELKVVMEPQTMSR